MIINSGFTPRIIIDTGTLENFTIKIRNTVAIPRLNKLFGKIKEKGVAIVPLKVYFKGSLVKVEIGLAKGKKLYDKRADIAKKDQKREAQRDFKIRNLG